MITPYTREMIDLSIKRLDQIILDDEASLLRQRTYIRSGGRIIKGENPAFIRAACEFMAQLRALN